MLARASGDDPVRPIAEHGELIGPSRPKNQQCMEQFERLDTTRQAQSLADSAEGASMGRTIRSPKL